MNAAVRPSRLTGMGTGAVARVAAAAGAITLLASCASASNGPARMVARVVVTGTVLTAPTCPVERSGHPCPPRPLPGALVAVYAAANRVASTSADRAGHFAVRLAPGSYRVQARMPAGLGNSASKHITVSDAPVRLTITVDSGIR
jgi:hypothetical protein